MLACLAVKNCLCNFTCVILLVKFYLCNFTCVILQVLSCSFFLAPRFRATGYSHFFGADFVHLSINPKARGFLCTYKNQ